jgi:riboflavin biosynthesis pyrimidine reductase
VTRFETYCERREKEALEASLSGFYTIKDASAGYDLVSLGSDWTRRLFDGDFFRVRERPGDVPLTSLVFVQSRDGNTVADDPSALGGGDTDKHLVYEGLSRVDADAVLAGAATARSASMVFSIWHPHLVELRCSRGKPRHPAQVVVTESGNVPIERGLMFEEPTLPVYLVTKSPVVAGLRARLRDRPWVDVVDAGDPVSLPAAMRYLRHRGLRVISAIGGRRAATALLRDGLISDIYLTTSPFEGGAPNTPFYEGPPLNLSRVLVKTGREQEAGVTFEHLLVKT